MTKKKETYKASMKEQKKQIADAKIFMKQRKKQMDLAYRIINPSIDYDKEYDILYIWFGAKNKVASTIELSDDLRMDINGKGNIIAIEICSFSKFQKRNSFK